MSDCPACLNGCGGARSDCPMREGGPVVRPLIGRPSSFTPDVAEEICGRLIEGQSLRTICSDNRMPGLRTVFQWLEKNQEFAQQYARAREVQAHVMADDTRDIVDTEEDAAKARVRMDQRKWQASKLLPKVYGDKLTLDATVARRAEDMTDDELASIAAGRGVVSAPTEGDKE